MEIRHFVENYKYVIGGILGAAGGFFAAHHMISNESGPPQSFTKDFEYKFFAAIVGGLLGALVASRLS